MKTTGMLLATASVAGLMAICACSRPAPAPALASDTPIAAASAAPPPDNQPPSDAPTMVAAASGSASASSGGCTTTYVGGGYQSGGTGMPGILTPGHPVTVCSAPTIARAPVPVALPVQAAPVAVRAGPAAAQSNQD